MEGKYKNQQNSIELNDLIDDAVNNAIARRYQAMNPEGDLSDISEQEMKDIVGGITLKPILAGRFLPILTCPTIGIIAQPDTLPLA